MKDDYYATDLEKENIIDQDHNVIPLDLFKERLTNALDAGTTLDMTLMTQRLIKYDFDFNALKHFYDNA